ncbi:MAG: hypothetical protein C5B44_03555, partial [Acidobacteria bacterium]
VRSRRIEKGRPKRKCPPGRAIVVTKNGKHSFDCIVAVDSKRGLAAWCAAGSSFLYSLEVVIQQPSMTNKTHSFRSFRCIRSDDGTTPGTDDVECRFVIFIPGVEARLIVLHYHLQLQIKLTRVVLKTNDSLSSSDLIQLAFRSAKRHDKY